MCAFGQNPQGEINWRNYRLDRIQKLIPLTWTDAKIPPPLVQLHQRQNLPQPDYIQEEMAKAWGFDFYQNASQMLLRFDRIHDQRYIQGTVRHETFKRVIYREAKSLIEKLTPPTEQKILLEIVGARSPRIRV